MTIATRAILVGLLAVAQPASAGQHVVRCESGSWSGHTIAQMNDGSFSSVDDKIGYKETIYIFSDESVRRASSSMDQKKFRRLL